ncbi:MAG: RNB domain-containing ribonuclease [Pseudanabaenaceae cyanobacterium]
MEFSVSQLLESFVDDKLFAPKLIEKKLGLSEAASHRLQIALDALTRIGLLEKDKGRYRRLEGEPLVVGKLRCSSRGFCFAIQESGNGDDIYIRESRLNSAWNGDRVLVKITKDGMRRRSPEGEVRLILDRANPTLLATVKAVEGGYRAFPLDDRLSCPVELEADEKHPDLSAAVDCLVHLEMRRYPIGDRPAVARIAAILGSDAESASDLELVRCKHNLPREFTPEAIALGQKAQPTTELVRRDLRREPAIALQNNLAFSLERVDGGWQLAVHIPDVASCIPAGSELDAIAAERGRSFLFAGQGVPMLPPLPIFDGLEYPAISVMFELDESGNTTSFAIEPTLISPYRLTEAAAQNLVSGQGEREPAIAKMLEALVALHPKLVAQRPDGFGLELPFLLSQEVDESPSGLPVDPPGQTVTAAFREVLILANRAIGAHMVALDLPGVFRVQGPPDVAKVNDWLRLLQCSGLSVPTELETVTLADLSGAMAQIQTLTDPHRRQILSYSLLGILPGGEYSRSKGDHFGLGIVDRAYVHAVDPANRYVDLLNQRLLHLVFTEGRDRRSSRSKDGVNLRDSRCHGQVSWSVLPSESERAFRQRVETLESKLNAQEALYRKALEDLDGLRKAEKMKPCIGQNFYGIVSSVLSYGFFVTLEERLVEGLVHVSSLKDDWYELPQSGNRSRGKQPQTRLVGRRSGREYALGARIEVQVRSVDYYRQQIDLVATASLAAEAAEAAAENVDAVRAE